MTSISTICGAFIVLCGCASVSTDQEAFRYGAEAKLIFKVVDEDGIAVSNSAVSVAFIRRKN